jgi:hypothetical protein
MNQAKLKVVSIDSLQVDPGNLRRRDAETEGMLESSLREFGPFRSLAVDRNLVTRAGNGTLKAAKAAGISEVLLVTPAPGQLVAVQRDDLTPSQLTAYSIADNRLTDRSQFDDAALVAALGGLEEPRGNVGSLGFTDEEINALEEAVGTPTRPRSGQAAGDDEAGPRLHFTLVFDSVDQQDHWFEFLRQLAQLPEAPATVGARIDRFLQAGNYGR